MRLEFKRLGKVAPAALITLMNHPLVRRQMPLLPEVFGETDCNTFITAKEQLWTEYGYGPWAIIIDGQFAGWGGLQPENGEADLALVLHPNFWGHGKTIFAEMVNWAFGEMQFETLTVLLPPTRTKVRSLQKLGFEADGVLEVGVECFNRYRLNRNTWQTRASSLTTPVSTPSSSQNI